MAIRMPLSSPPVRSLYLPAGKLRLVVPHPEGLQCCSNLAVLDRQCGDASLRHGRLSASHECMLARPSPHPPLLPIWCCPAGRRASRRREPGVDVYCGRLLGPVHHCHGAGRLVVALHGGAPGSGQQAGGRALPWAPLLAASPAVPPYSLTSSAWRMLLLLSPLPLCLPTVLASHPSR